MRDLNFDVGLNYCVGKGSLYDKIVMENLKRGWLQIKFF